MILLTLSGYSIASSLECVQRAERFSPKFYALPGYRAEVLQNLIPASVGTSFPAYYYPFLPAFVGAPPRMRLNPSVNLVGVPQHYVGAEPDEERITEQDAVRTCCRYTHEDPIRRPRNNPVIHCLVWFADTWLTVSCSSGRRLIFDSLDPERIVPAVEL